MPPLRPPLISAEAAHRRGSYLTFYLALLLGISLTLGSLAQITIPEGPKFGRLKGVTHRVAEVNYRITHDSRPIDIAFLGSSHTWTAIADGQIERELNLLGADTTVANLASTWMGRDLHLFYLKKLLDQKRPRLVIIEITDHEYAFGHDLLPYVGESADIFCCNPYLDPTFPSHFALFLKNKVSTKLDLVKHPWNDSNHTPPAKDYGWLSVKRNWQQAIPNSDTPSLRQKIKYKAFALTSEYGKNVVKQMSELTKQHQIKIAFLYLPVFEYARQDPAIGFEFYKSIGPIITVPRDISSNSNYWFDESHINAFGAEKIAPRMAEAIHQILSDQEAR